MIPARVVPSNKRFWHCNIKELFPVVIAALSLGKLGLAS